MFDDTGLFNDKLQEWENYNNYQPPMARSAAKPRTRD
jgi:hypothetical protein